MERPLEGPGVAGEAPAMEKVPANQDFGRIPGGSMAGIRRSYSARSSPMLLESLERLRICGSIQPII
ncbi:MAG: hypothetical protein LBU32_02910 [Clostridiales bacterium]|nr:hypothetical protein [Clostridiales bacterium]